MFFSHLNQSSFIVILKFELKLLLFITAFCLFVAGYCMSLHQKNLTTIKINKTCFIHGILK